MWCRERVTFDGVTKIKRFKLHGAWGVLLGCTLLTASAVGMLTNSTGLFFTAIIKDLGFSGASLSLHYSIATLASALSVPFATKLFLRWKIRPFMALYSLLLPLCYLAMAVYTKPYQWYISAIPKGIVIGVSLVVMSSVIKNWFTDRSGTALGICLSSSGVVSMILNPVIAGAIERYGWRTTVFVLSLIALAVMQLSSLLLAKQPSDVGMEPLGRRTSPLPQRQKAEPRGLEGASQGRRYLTVFICITSGALMSTLMYYLPQLSESLGNSLTFGAWLSSANNCGNVLAKLLFGVLCDRKGIWKTLIYSYCVFLLALLLLLLGSTVEPLLLAGSFLLGTSFSVSTVGWSLGCLEVFGKQNFEIPYSRLTMIYSLVSAGFQYVVALLYDATSSFQSVFLVGVVLCALSLLATLVTKRKMKQSILL